MREELGRLRLAWSLFRSSEMGMVGRHIKGDMGRGEGSMIKKHRNVK